MLPALISAFVAGSVTAYPIWGDKGLVKPKAVGASPKVEAVLDKGPILELIVRCPSGTAILSYSKVEKLYCSPQHRCDRSLQVVVQRTCF